MLEFENDGLDLGSRASPDQIALANCRYYELG